MVFLLRGMFIGGFLVSMISGMPKMAITPECHPPTARIRAALNDRPLIWISTIGAGLPWGPFIIVVRSRVKAIVARPGLASFEVSLPQGGAASSRTRTPRR